MIHKTKTVASYFFIIGISLSIHNLQAESLTFESGKEKTSLLELYTSEGCSSCPPADRWLSALVDDNKLWQEFIPLAFHVDYWDYIGWKDRFASPSYSKRQRRYAQEQSLRTVYTPGFILNGKKWRKRSVKQLNANNIQKNPGLLKLEVTGNTVSVDFKPDERIGDKLKINLALLGFKLKTSVTAGENSGRTLPHNFVVLELKHSRLELNKYSYQARLKIPESEIYAAQYGLVAWVSGVDKQRPIQATGGWLPRQFVTGS
ncbi:MAG: DUF1223 domain-containing protein [Gammaproteobacteria bacterium]|nr:DUF1223 domain-containing protein [Gammaproteobacteria bacterium]